MIGTIDKSWSYCDGNMLPALAYFVERTHARLTIAILCKQVVDVPLRTMLVECCEGQHYIGSVHCMELCKRLLT